MANKLWQKKTIVNSDIERYTIGKDAEMDMYIARYDVLGSMAHAKMLESIGLLEKSDLNAILKGLKEIFNQIENDEFVIEDGVEDIHSQVEMQLGDAGKKLHSGRSRNDQVLVDLRLFSRAKLKEVVESVYALFGSLISQSERYKNVLMPGYTHLQIAMPSSFGLWFGAYAESLIDDMRLVVAAYDTANQNPLGSAAGYGSSFPLNREMTTELLGFETLHYNAVAAQMSRGKTERATAFAVAALASTIGRFAMDVCVFMCQNFGFISFPDNLTTGSSIMPHKKNPDVFEITRGKCNRLQAVPNEIALLTANLPLGYHRDMQLLKDIIFPATREICEVMEMCDFMLQHIRINEGILEDNKYNYLFTVEDVNRLVLEGLPFREAYRSVGIAVQEGRYTPTREVHHTHAGSIGNLCNDKIKEKMESVLSSIK
jgi:argininosuccinate lyase